MDDHSGNLLNVVGPCSWVRRNAETGATPSTSRARTVVGNSRWRRWNCSTGWRASFHHRVGICTATTIRMRRMPRCARRWQQGQGRRLRRRSRWSRHPDPPVDVMPDYENQNQDLVW